MFAVFVQGGCADDLNFAAAQSGLEYVGGINCSLGCAGAYYGVQLVNEQNDVACFLNFLEGSLYALLKVAPVLGSRQHSGEIQGYYTAVGQVLGNVTCVYFLRQTFRDGRFTDAGLPNQYGVILGTPAEDLNDSLYLLLTADNWV